MALHVHERPDLADSQVLAITQRHQLIKCAEQLVCISENFPLIQTLAGARHDLSEQVQGVDVLQDVGLPIGDEHHIELVEGLVDESDIVLLDSRVLRAAVGELGEGCQERFYSRPRHLTKLPREDSFPSPGANRSCKDHLW